MRIAAISHRVCLIEGAGGDRRSRRTRILREHQ